MRYRKRVGLVCLFVFSHCTSPTDFETTSSPVKASGTSTAMGRIHTQRTGACFGYLVCEDVVVTTGRCVGSPHLDPKKIRFDRAPEGRYPISTGIRLEYFLGKSAGSDIAAVKLDKAYSDIQGSWEERIPHDGPVARDWVADQKKKLCSAPSKEFFVQVYPGSPAEVSAQLRGRPDMKILECPAANGDMSPGCVTKLLPGDQVILRANQLWKKFRFQEWRPLAETVCPCGGGQRTLPECQFGSSEVEARTLGCVAVYVGPGIAPLVRTLSIPTLAEMQHDRKHQAASVAIPGLSNFLDPARFMAMPDAKE
jgi:hypothetical protein